MGERGSERNLGIEIDNKRHGETIRMEYRRQRKRKSRKYAIDAVYRNLCERNLAIRQNNPIESVK